MLILQKELCEIHPRASSARVKLINKIKGWKNGVGVEKDLFLNFSSLKPIPAKGI